MDTSILTKIRKDEISVLKEYNSIFNIYQTLLFYNLFYENNHKVINFNNFSFREFLSILFHINPELSKMNTAVAIKFRLYCT
jgi:hypothetical protein